MLYHCFLQTSVLQVYHHGQLQWEIEYRQHRMSDSSLWRASLNQKTGTITISLSINKPGIGISNYFSSCTTFQICVQILKRLGHARFRSYVGLALEHSCSAFVLTKISTIRSWVKSSSGDSFCILRIDHKSFYSSKIDVNTKPRLNWGTILHQLNLEPFHEKYCTSLCSHNLILHIRTPPSRHWGEKSF